MNRRTRGLAAVLLAAGAAHGAGFQLYTEGSAEALGQAAAISGRTNLTSLAWYNPAALAGAEKASVMAGITLVQIRTDFQSDLGSANNSSMSDKWRTIPHFYYVQPLAEKLTTTLSVNAPYGLITEWKGDWVGNAAAIYSDLSAVYMTPTLAVQLNDAVSLSAGFNVVHGSVELTADRDLTTVFGFDFGKRRVEGEDDGYGYTASAHVDLAEGWAAGVRYQSRVKLKFEGDATLGASPTGVTKYNVNGKLMLPSTINFGVANTLIDHLALGLDCVWSEWSTYDQLVFNFASGYPLPNPDVVSKRWNDVWSIRLGGEYELNDNWLLRGGYVWDQSPLEGATRAPELPGSDRQMVMGGLGWHGESVGIDLAYSYLWAEKGRTGAEVNAATGGATAGEYDTTTHLIALSASYTF